MTAYPEKILLVGAGAALMVPGAEGGLNRFSFIPASSASEAAAVLETTPRTAAVIAEPKLPGTNGLEFLSRVRDRWPASRRLLLLTASGEDADGAASALADGRLNRILTPPFEADALAEILRQAVEEYRFAANTEVRPRGVDVSAPVRVRTPQCFLAMMNHELRTPLNHILGFSTLLEQRCKQKGDLEPLEYLAYIRESGQTLLRTFNRLLEIARLTAEDFRPEPDCFDLGSVIRQEIERQRPAARQRGLTLAFDMPQQPVLAAGSEADIAQALAELIDNAIKFNQPGGHVSVAMAAGARDVAVRVADTGVGMGDADMNRVLRALRCTEMASQRCFDGSGIGLTLASLTAKAYGGRLSIESRKGHGTAVVLRLKRGVEARRAAKIA